MNSSLKQKKPGWYRVRRRVFVAVVFAYVAICAIVAINQRQLIYHPPVFDATTADQMAAIKRLERWTTSSGEPIGWKRPSPRQPSEGQMLIFHGNGDTALDCSGFADVIQRIAPLDAFMPEYPGYGDLPGKPTEHLIDAAVDRAINSLSPKAPIYLVGESLGTGVATWLAGRHPDRIAGVILLAPYNRLSAVGQRDYPFLPVRLLLRDQFASDEYLRTYSGPVAILVGGADNVVPEKFGRRLYDGYGGPKRLWEFPADDHGTVMQQPLEVWSEILAFLRPATAAR
jgi:pimeloyl-ACP methyl ester carboxylesterase